MLVCLCSAVIFIIKGSLEICRMKKKAILIIILVSVIAAFYVFHLGQYFTLEGFKANKDELYALYGQHRVLFVAGYLVLYVFSSLFFLPIAAVLTLAGGALFGIFTGAFLAVIGASVGAVLAFLAARNLLRDWVVSTFGNKIAALDQGIANNGLSYLLFMRLVPVFPFFLVNIACGLTNLRLGTYIFGTVAGSIPGSLVYANAGASLASISSMQDIAGPRVLASFALLGFFALIPIFYRLKSRKGPG
jgi:uncharacterized membrane protein YdjX (TVP38/TMEM64 family)